jgi:hypothetical protein
MDAAMACTFCTHRPAERFTCYRPYRCRLDTHHDLAGRPPVTGQTRDGNHVALKSPAQHGTPRLRSSVATLTSSG